MCQNFCHLFWKISQTNGDYNMLGNNMALACPWDVGTLPQNVMLLRFVSVCTIDCAVQFALKLLSIYCHFFWVMQFFVCCMSFAHYMHLEMCFELHWSCCSDLAHLLWPCALDCMNKLAKARKMRKPGTLSLKKVGLGNLWVKKSLDPEYLHTCNTLRKIDFWKIDFWKIDFWKIHFR